ncbi:hypothetical protein NC652_023265 [Populus alba x Populus x berolinensis]|nr:hypothetical protein NC652_023265 [Populus alba x Populus x berolinensis]
MTSTTMFITSILILFFLVNSSAAHYTPCSESFHHLTQDKNFSNCKKMTTLGVEFGWEVNKHNSRGNCASLVELSSSSAEKSLRSSRLGGEP